MSSGYAGYEPHNSGAVPAKILGMLSNHTLLWCCSKKNSHQTSACGYPMSEGMGKKQAFLITRAWAKG
jgi:hypothetical protein